MTKNTEKQVLQVDNSIFWGEAQDNFLQSEVCYYNGGSGEQPKKAIPYNFSDYVINLDSVVQEETITIKIGGTPIGVVGELTVINGQSKAGKTTSIVPNLIASSYLDENTAIDTLSIKSVHNNGNPIIYIDTEQTKSRTHKIIKTACKIAGMSEHPNNFYTLNIKSIPHLEKKDASFEMIDQIIKKTNKLPFLIIIDGFADFVIDPNRAEDSFLVIDEILRKAEQYQCTIIGFLHMNPNSDKMRGHLGSHSERKAGTIISVEKKNDIHFITPQFIRHGKDFEPIPFVWSNEESRFMSMTGVEAEMAKKREKDKDFNKNFIYVKTMQEIIRLTGQTHFTYKELEIKIGLHYHDKKKPSKSMAKNHITAMTKNEIINKNEDGVYGLNPSSELIYS